MLRALTRLLLSVVALAAANAVAAAQTAGDPDAERKADLVTAYKILVNEGILDSFGHVSVRSSKDPNVFYMPRAMPPVLVSQDDLVELRVSDSQLVNGERYIHGEIYKARPDVMSVYAAYIDINARMQTQALLLSHNIVLMDQSELFTRAEFDINRPWEHLRQKTLDDAAKAKVDRAQFGLDQTQIKQ